MSWEAGTGRPGDQPGESISVALVDDQQIVLAGVAAVLDQQPDMRVVGTANNLASAVELISEASPDVVVSDIQIGQESGLALLETFPDGRPAIILLSSFEHPSYYQAAIERGAAGYVLKDAVIDSLVLAIRDVAAGRISFPASAIRRGGAAARPPSLRELEIVHLVAEGGSNDEIAARLGISPKTVDSHLRALFDRYQVVSRTELAMLAVSEGWLRRARTQGPSARVTAAYRWMIDEQIVKRR